MKCCEICGSMVKTRKNAATNKILCEKHYRQILKYGEVTDASAYNQNHKNEIVLKDSYAILFLRNRYGIVVAETKIDIDDIELVKQYKWSLGTHGYVTSGSAKNQVLLHRLLSHTNKNDYVDHVNRDRLDNRKVNFRLCTSQENARNKNRYTRNTSGVVGVTYEREREKWKAQIVINDKNIFLGRYNSFFDAVVARQKAEKEYFKEFSPSFTNPSAIYSYVTV